MSLVKNKWKSLQMKDTHKIAHEKWLDVSTFTESWSIKILWTHSKDGVMWVSGKSHQGMNRKIGKGVVIWVVSLTWNCHVTPSLFCVHKRSPSSDWQRFQWVLKHLFYVCISFGDLFTLAISHSFLSYFCVTHNLVLSFSKWHLYLSDIASFQIIK